MLAALAMIAGALVVAGLASTWKIAPRSHSDRLIELLRAQPGRAIGELAQELYGSDAEADRSRTRALLTQLRRAGKVKNVGPGHWEAVSLGQEIIEGLFGEDADSGKETTGG